MSTITQLQVLQACEACRRQWSAYRRCHGQPAHPKRPPVAPQSPIEALMERTGCDALRALMSLQAAQEQGLVILPEDGVSEPHLTKAGRAILDAVDQEIEPCVV